MLFRIIQKNVCIISFLISENFIKFGCCSNMRKFFPSNLTWIMSGGILISLYTDCDNGLDYDTNLTIFLPRQKGQRVEKVDPFSGNAVHEWPKAKKA